MFKTDKFIDIILVGSVSLRASFAIETFAFDVCA